MSSSILREIAALSNPTPQDFDPEDIRPEYEGSDSDSDTGIDPTAGREHYVEVRLVNESITTNEQQKQIKDCEYNIEGSEI